MINTGDTAFMMMCAALVFIMTPGLAFFYGGLVSRKNVLTIMMQSFISMGVVTILWFIIGFSLTFGPDVHGLVGGLKYMFLHGVGMEANPDYGSTIPFMSFFSYQQMFAILTPALITGAFADRVNFKSYLVFLVLWSLLIYIPLAHWVWGGGFLQQMGVVDFAGGIVVHASAGLAALASVFFVGKRTVVSKAEMEPHNVTHVALGTALLWFGWFGFNAGGALGANSLAATAFINTDLGASAAMVTWLIISWIREKSPSFVGVLTGAVAGLATITPGAGFVKPWAAIIIGVLAGIICYAAVQFRKKLDWDDALDVWGVHGVGGLVLGASEHFHLAAVHIAGQIVARGSVNFQTLARGQGATKVALGVGLHDADGVGFGKGRAHGGIGLLEVLRSQFHDNGFSHAITLPRTSRRGFPVPSR